MSPLEVRQQLVDALVLDLIGPTETADGRQLGAPDEELPQAPASWYLTGFLVPLDADASQRAEESGDDDLDEISDSRGTDDAVTPEPAAARQRFLPSSIGLSLLVATAGRQLDVTVRWGDYRAQRRGEGQSGPTTWRRIDRQQQMTVDLPDATAQPRETPVPASGGLRLALSVRGVPGDGNDVGLPPGTRSVSLFLVNRRRPAPDDVRDEAFAFQAELEVTADTAFVPRPNVRSMQSDDWDERVADLQYRDASEFAVGHSVATTAKIEIDGSCRGVRTCWVPAAEVERVAPADIDDLTISMDALAQLAGGDDAQTQLGGVVPRYRDWIDAQRRHLPSDSPRRMETAGELLKRAQVAADRIEAGSRS